MSIEHILIIDDDPLLQEFLFELLSSRGYFPSVAENISIAKKKIKANRYDLIISDMNMPDGTGMDVIHLTKQRSPRTPILMITAYGSIENAVEAMRQGAFNYLTKPFSSEALLAFISKAEELQNLVQENLFLASQTTTSSYPLIAESQVMKNLLAKAKRAAQSSANLFIHGESGCGKEILSFFYSYELPKSTPPLYQSQLRSNPRNTLRI